MVDSWFECVDYRSRMDFVEVGSRACCSVIVSTCWI